VLLTRHWEYVADFLKDAGPPPILLNPLRWQPATRTTARSKTRDRSQHNQQVLALFTPAGRLYIEPPDPLLQLCPK